MNIARRGFLATMLFGAAAARAGGPFAEPVTGREALRRRALPNVPLVTHDGARVSFYDDLVKDKVVVFSFMYADCQNACPMTTANLKRVRKILDREIVGDVWFYSLTIKPDVDTPAKLHAYAQMHGVLDDRRWLFLTGAPNDLDELRHRLGFADPDPNVDQDRGRHAGMLRYANEARAIWGSCESGADPSWIAEEIRFAVPRARLRSPRANEG